MIAVAWAAIALLGGTLLGVLFFLGSRIDGLGSRIDGLGARLDGRIDGLAARIDAQTARLDALTQQLTDHVGRHAG